MDTSPITKLTESVTAAHKAIAATREAARQIAAVAAATPPRPASEQGQANSGGQ